jgi:hypothetical protein
MRLKAARPHYYRQEDSLRRLQEALSSSVQDLVYLVGDVERFLAAVDQGNKKERDREIGNMRARLSMFVTRTVTECRREGSDE